MCGSEADCVMFYVVQGVGLLLVRLLKEVVASDAVAATSRWGPGPLSSLHVHPRICIEPKLESPSSRHLLIGWRCRGPQ